MSPLAETDVGFGAVKSIGVGGFGMAEKQKSRPLQVLAPCHPGVVHGGLCISTTIDLISLTSFRGPFNRDRSMRVRSGTRGPLAVPSSDCVTFQTGTLSWKSKKNTALFYCSGCLEAVRELRARSSHSFRISLTSPWARFFEDSADRQVRPRNRGLYVTRTDGTGRPHCANLRASSENPGNAGTRASRATHVDPRRSAATVSPKPNDWPVSSTWCKSSTSKSLML